MWWIKYELLILNIKNFPLFYNILQNKIKPNQSTKTTKKLTKNKQTKKTGKYMPEILFKKPETIETTYLLDRPQRISAETTSKFK